jgi:hypothetical protein
MKRPAFSAINTGAALIATAAGGLAVGAPVQPAHAQEKMESCRVAQRVTTPGGVPATVIATKGSGCTVRTDPENHSLVSTWAAFMFKPMASSPVAPPRAVTPGVAKLGSYHCVFFINGMLQTVPGFTLQGGGRYTHQNGGGGTYRANAGVIEFSGGPLAGQAGKLGPNKVHLFNESRSRTVIDCGTK